MEEIDRIRELEDESEIKISSEKKKREDRIEKTLLEKDEVIQKALEDAKKKAFENEKRKISDAESTAEKIASEADKTIQDLREKSKKRYKTAVDALIGWMSK